MRTQQLIAVQDRNRHNTPRYAYGIVKAFVLCELLDGDFVQNSETTESGFFTSTLPLLWRRKKTEDKAVHCAFRLRRQNGGKRSLIEPSVFRCILRAKRLTARTRYL